MSQDHASARQVAKTMLNMQATLARPIAYDKSIAFNIRDRFGNGQGLEAIMLAPAGYTSLASIRKIGNQNRLLAKRTQSARPGR